MIESATGTGPAAPRAPGPAEWAPDPLSAQGDTSKDFKLFGEDGFGFRDMLDIINPLQHIPLLSTLYRKLTGDELSPGARIAGATLFGGPIGAALALTETAVEYKTGRDIGANALAALIGDDAPDAPSGTAVAAIAAPAQGFASAGQPIALVPTSFIGAAPAAGQDPIDLAPRLAIEPWQPPVAPPPAAAQTVAAAPPTPAAPKPGKQTIPPEVAAARIAAIETAEIATPEPHMANRRGVPPASDIPSGAQAGLSRMAMRAYAVSMNAAAPGHAAANPASAVNELERATAAAQNDWIVEAMTSAMAKYEAGHRLQSAGTMPTQSVVR